MGGWLGVWPPLPPGAWLRRSVDPLPYPLGEPGSRLYREGRDAVWHGVRALGLVPGDQVLVPAYHAGPEVEALVRAGQEVIFYEGDEDLRPEASELEGLVGPRTRALSLVHYLGFPQDAASWRAWCDERGILLIEDAAQAWLASREGTPVGALGDLALWSVYKIVGTPDGALAICRDPLAPTPRARKLSLGKLAHMHGAWLGQRWVAVGRLRKGAEYPFDAAVHNVLDDPNAPASASTSYLLRRLSDPHVAERRRRNYQRLLEALADRVPRPFGQLLEGACPWFFPVETDDKLGLIAHLAAKGVGSMDFWSLPHPAMDAERFPRAARRRGRTVALPVHQELREGDVQRVADAAEAWYQLAASV